MPMLSPERSPGLTEALHVGVQPARSTGMQGRDERNHRTRAGSVHTHRLSHLMPPPRRTDRPPFGSPSRFWVVNATASKERGPDQVEIFSPVGGAVRVIGGMPVRPEWPPRLSEGAEQEVQADPTGHGAQRQEVARTGCRGQGAQQQGRRRSAAGRPAGSATARRRSRPARPAGPSWWSGGGDPRPTRPPGQAGPPTPVSSTSPRDTMAPQADVVQQGHREGAAGTGRCSQQGWEGPRTRRGDSLAFILLPPHGGC